MLSQTSRSYLNQFKLFCQQTKTASSHSQYGCYSESSWVSVLAVSSITWKTSLWIYVERHKKTNQPPGNILFNSLWNFLWPSACLLRWLSLGHVPWLSQVAVGKTVLCCSILHLDTVREQSDTIKSFDSSEKFKSTSHPVEPSGVLPFLLRPLLPSHTRRKHLQSLKQRSHQSLSNSIS